MSRHEFSEDPRALGGEPSSSSTSIILVAIAVVCGFVMLACGGLIVGAVFMVRTAQQQAQVAMEQARATLAAQGQTQLEIQRLTREARYAEALQLMDEALAESPDNDYWLNNKAWLLATCPVADCRDGQQAVELATQACELTSYGHAGYVDTLAAAYAETGDFESAVKWQEKAVELNQEGFFGSVEEFRARLDLFRNQQPYREGPEPRDMSQPESPHEVHRPADAAASEQAGSPSDHPVGSEP